MIAVSDDDGEVSQTPAQSVELVGHNLMHTARPDLCQHGFESWPAGGRTRRGISEDNWVLPAAHLTVFQHLVFL